METAYIQLCRFLHNATIVDSRSYHKRFRKPPLGRVVKSFRHGKWISLLLEGDTLIRINFGMSGRLVFGNQKLKHRKWAILIESNKRRKAIEYVDPRGFGRLEVYRGTPARHMAASKTLIEGSAFSGLGPDLLSNFMQTASDSRRLAIWIKALASSKPVKVVLMDQSRLAGLGNIYANELCSLTKINPNRPANSLTRIELMRMVRMCPKLLNAAIAFGGTSFGDANTYRDVNGIEGRFAEKLSVYGRSRCDCGSKIKKYKLGGRSTFHCVKCQDN